jgi:UDP-N-acetylmuramyl pentapeptide synthase
MADEFDVSSKRVTGTGALGVGRTRIRMVVITVSGAGRLTLTSGNGGATKIDMDFGAAGTYDIFIPGTGVLFDADPYISTATNMTAATVFWS